MNRSLRWAVLERDSFTCRYCGRRAPDVELEVDHVEPRSKGGLDTFDNLVTACVDCNQGKRARDARHAISLADRLRDAELDVALLADLHGVAVEDRARLEEALENAGYAIEHLRYVAAALREGRSSEPTSVAEILDRMGR